MRRIGRGARRWLPRLIGPAILVLLLTRVDLKALATILRSADLTLVGAAVALLVPVLLLRTHRWVLLLSTQGVILGWSRALAVYAFSAFIGTVTPGRLGEFVKVVYLQRREGLPFGSAFASSFLDRLFDVILLFVIAAPALAWFLGARSAAAIGALIFVAVLAIVAMLVIASPGRRSWIVERVRRTHVKGADRAAEHLGLFGEAVRSLTMPVIVVTTLESIAVWMINWMAIFVAARSVGIEMRYVDVVGVSAIAALLVLLPITVLGIGTRDATFVVLLARIGLSREAAIALSSLSLMLLVTFGLICSLSLLSREARESGSSGLEGGNSDGRTPMRHG